MFVRKAFAIVSLLVGTAAIIAGGTANDSKVLDGQWTIIAGVKDGKEEAHGTLKNIIATISGDKMTIAEEGIAVPKRRSIVVDPTKSPKWFDLIRDDGGDKGERTHGIYKIEGDKLFICFHEGVEKKNNQRPTEFASPVGSGLTLVTLQRKK